MWAKGRKHLLDGGPDLTGEGDLLGDDVWIFPNAVFPDNSPPGYDAARSRAVVSGQRACVGQSAFVCSAGSDRAASQLLQVRRLHRGHVPGVLHPSTARQGRPVLPAKQLSRCDTARRCDNMNWGLEVTTVDEDHYSRDASSTSTLGEGYWKGQQGLNCEMKTEAWERGWGSWGAPTAEKFSCILEASDGFS